MSIGKILIIGLLVSSFAAVGNWLVWLDSFANFQLYLAILGVGLSFTGIYKRHHICSLCLIGLSIYHFTIVIPWYIPDQNLGKELKDTGDLKILSFNVHAFNESYPDLIDYFEAEDPDILCILEGSHHLRDRMQHLHTKYPERLEASRRADVSIREVAGFILWSKHPLLEHEFIITPNNQVQAIRIIIKHQQRAVEILAIHPPSPKKFWDVYRRNQFFSELPNHFSETPHRIVIGDFNTTLNSAILRNWDQRGLRNAHLEAGLRHTWPSPLHFFGIAIDHAYVSDSFVINDYELGPFISSDHLPQEITLSFANSADL